ELNTRQGKLFADLSIGADVAGAKALLSNKGIAFRGVTLMGSGFWIKPGDILIRQEPDVIKPLRNGKDLTATPRGVFAIDFFGLTLDQAKNQFPASFQRVLNGVKPERDQSKRSTYQAKWWLFAEARPDLRAAKAGLPRYLATSMTAKHRFFQFLDENILPDQGIVAITIADAFALGILSTRVHTVWALASGGRLGVGNDPRYNHSRCFETFPFPAASDTQIARIRDLAEQIDAHRKRQQAQHPSLTLTGLYNVLDALRRETPLTPKDKTIHEQGLVSLLRELHDELDTAVFAAYGWGDLADPLIGCPGATCPWPDKPAAQLEAEEALLTRLVALNAERAAEEAQGQIRWLRPEYQHPEPASASAAAQQAADLDQPAPPPTPATANKPKAFPAARAGMREQIAAVRAALG
ncbi:MAG: type IIL restriction-modification enzyme MmeI, partial [Lamprobacter sp.]|uniref:type IIL restriction-modification enzyme MmeI n=1 Tax=Lamprobacter sp. TaxID=3100796 RepID=UPI002B259879